MKPVVEKKTGVDEKDLEMRVKDMYRKVALYPEEKYHFEMGRTLAERLGYPSEILDKIPKEAIDSFAGVGYYFDMAQLKEGECVVDLGSGSGMDVFFAALQVGKEGEVSGFDMTAEQLQKSINLKEKAGFEQVYFRESYIEEIPVRSNCVDVVISNGVINLSHDKERVFHEAARILKTGGRLAIADIVSSVKLPANISCDANLWAACIGGAMQIDEYRTLINNSGLRIIKEKENPYSFISKSAMGATRDYGIKSISLIAIKE